MAHGTEPLLLFDITKAMFMVPEIVDRLETHDLITIHACQLAKRDEDLASMHEHLLKSRFASITDFECRFANTIHDFDFKPGSLVLVLNKKIKPVSNAKCKPRYFRPMIIVSCAQNRSYHLTEVDGTISKLKFAMFRLIPYFPYSLSALEVTQFVNIKDLASVAPVEEEDQLRTVDI